MVSLLVVLQRRSIRKFHITIRTIEWPGSARHSIAWMHLTAMLRILSLCPQPDVALFAMAWPGRVLSPIVVDVVAVLVERVHVERSILAWTTTLHRSLANVAAMDVVDVLSQISTVDLQATVWRWTSGVLEENVTVGVEYAGPCCCRHWIFLLLLWRLL
jgi:hypothetical protein